MGIIRNEISRLSKLNTLAGSNNMNRRITFHQAGQTRIHSTQSGPTSLGIQRYMRFLDVLSLIRKSEGVNVPFQKNDYVMKCLIYSHLTLIVGTDTRTNDITSVKELIGLDTIIRNLIWITSRQNGKSTLVSVFITALLATSVHTGSLVNIYATDIHRTGVILSEVKRLLTHLIGTQYEPKIIVNTKTQIELITIDNIQHECMARPRTVDGCRGDSAAANIFDEASFVKKDFVIKFAFPLLPNNKCIFTFVSSPPSHDTYFHELILDVMAGSSLHSRFFTYINHSIVCPSCTELDNPAKCTHKLDTIPPWKSVIKLALTEKLLPHSERNAFLTEMLGTLKKQEGSMFIPKLINALEQRDLLTTSCLSHFTNIYVAIDPPSHLKSSMGICAMAFGTSGEIVVLALSLCRATRADVEKLCIVVKHLIRDLRNHPWVNASMVIKAIIECNNNEIMARSLLNSIASMGGRMDVPWTRENGYSKFVAPGLGVYTTDVVKWAMVDMFQDALNCNRIRMAIDGIAVNSSVYDPETEPTTFKTLIQTVCKQLKAFRERPDGTLSGKTCGGGDDDGAMVIMLALFWGNTDIRNTNTETGVPTSSNNRKRKKHPNNTSRKRNKVTCLI